MHPAMEETVNSLLLYRSVSSLAVVEPDLALGQPRLGLRTLGRFPQPVDRGQR